MHCPNCGAITASEQKYCRSCGFGLEKFSQLFAEQSLASRLKSQAPELPASLQEQRPEVVPVVFWSRLRLILRGMLVPIVLYIIYLIMSGGPIDRFSIIMGLMYIVFTLGLGISIAFLLKGRNKKMKSGTLQRKQPEPKLTWENTLASETILESQPDAHHEPLFGVTEDTTKMLPVSLKGPIAEDTATSQPRTPKQTT